MCPFESTDILGCCPFIGSSGSINELKNKLLKVKIRKKAFIDSLDNQKMKKVDTKILIKYQYVAEPYTAGRIIVFYLQYQ